MRASLLLGTGGVAAGVVAIVIAEGRLPTAPVLALLLASALPGAVAALPRLVARIDQERHVRLMRGCLPVQVALLLAAIAVDGSASPLMFLLVLPLLPAAWTLSPAGVCWLGASAVAALALLAHVTNALTATTFATAAVLALMTIAGALTAHAEQRLRAAHAELAALAHRDGLTGCLNHRAFQERLEAEVNRAQRHDRALALMLIDFDDFKGLNDAYGHPAGDRLLHHLGTILAQVCRAEDVPARLGGDEFALLLPETRADEALHVAERVHAHVAAVSDPQPITISIGISALPDPAVTARNLVEQADAALYAAKHAGRGLIRRYVPPTPDAAVEARASMPTGISADHAFARHVRKLLSRDQLTVSFQPVIRLSDDTLVAYDAVVRIGDSELPLPRWMEVVEHIAGLPGELEEAWWTAVARCGPPPRGTHVLVEVGGHATTAELRRVLTRELTGPGRGARGHDFGHRAVTSDLAKWGEAMTTLSVREALSSSAEPVERLAVFEPRWFKLPSRLVGRCEQQPGRLALITALRSFADRSGGGVIADGVARPEEARALHAAGVGYATGSLWGPPGPPWPAVHRAPNGHAAGNLEP